MCVTLIKLSYLKSTMLLNGEICVSVQLYTRTYRDTLLRISTDTRRGAPESTDRPFCPYNIAIATSIYVNPNCWPLIRAFKYWSPLSRAMNIADAIEGALLIAGKYLIVIVFHGIGFLDRCLRLRITEMVEIRRLISVSLTPSFKNLQSQLIFHLVLCKRLWE